MSKIEIDETLEVIVPIRMFPSKVKQVDDFLTDDKEERWNDRSHFVRSAINFFIRNNLKDEVPKNEKEAKRKTNKLGSVSRTGGSW